jgi:hypothetical protein
MLAQPSALPQEVAPGVSHYKSPNLQLGGAIDTEVISPAFIETVGIISFPYQGVAKVHDIN